MNLGNGFNRLPRRIAVIKQPVGDPNTPIGEILKAVGSEGIMLESDGQRCSAPLPLDDEVIDLLIKRSARFRANCHEIRERMESGQFQTHEDVRRQLVGAQSDLQGLVAPCQKPHCGHSAPWSGHALNH